MHIHLTHAYSHWLADVHSAGFAPAFTLSLCDSERSRNPPMPIASVVSGKHKKKLRQATVEISAEIEKNIIMTLDRNYETPRSI